MQIAHADGIGTYNAMTIVWEWDPHARLYGLLDYAREGRTHWVLATLEKIFGIHDDRPNILPLQRYCDIVAKDVREVTQSRYEARLGPLQQE